LTREQLQATRAERWHQKGEALLTFEAARTWLQETGICLFLPRKMQLPAPAPSFVEACLGETNSTPARADIEAATALLVRLIDAGEVVALNLLGVAGEQPDFLVTPEFLPYIFALRGDRDWKHDPPSTGTGRVSPLVLEVWKTIERTGVQTAIEIRETLGKELTEAAVLRALNELWTGMRVILLPGENGEPATWEALKTRYEKACAAGTATSLVTALSVLLARYLQSAVAATSEEAEIFLSPLASRSKVREVIRGLSATRQLETYSLDAQPLLYVEGTLPEFGEPIALTDIEALPAIEGAASPAGSGSRIRKYTRRPVTGPDPLRWKRDSSVPLPPGARRSSTGDKERDDARGATRPEGEKFAARRTPARPASRPATARPASVPRREGAEGEKKRWTPRDGAADRPRREGGFARPAGKFAPRRDSEAPNRGAGSAGGERPAFGSRPPAARGFGSRPAGPRSMSSRPSTAREFGKSSDGRGAESGEKKRFSPAAGSSRPRTFGAGADRPRSDRPAGDRPARPYSPRPAGSRPPSPGARSGYPKAGGSKFGPRRPAGAAPGEGAGSAKKGRWVPRTGAGDRREERPRREGGFAGPSGRVSTRSGGGAARGRTSTDRPYSPRPSGTRPSSSRPQGARPSAGSTSRPSSKPYSNRTADGKFAPRREGSGGARSGGPGGERPSYTKPWAERPLRPAGARPRTEGSRPEGARARPEGSFERKRPTTGGAASGERRPRTFGSRPPSGRPSSGRPSSGRPGFKARPSGSGKPGGFSKKRGPGDYPPRKKRPE
jgi:23S rRNA pseudouridine2605 synthase